jgi:hypothetical protein
MNTNEEIVAHEIKKHQRTIRYLLATALGTFLLGMIVIVFSFFDGDIPNVPSIWVKVMGGVISSLCALPVRDILDHQDKAETATIIQSNYRAIIEAPNSVSKEERKRVFELMTQLVNSAM